MEFLEMIDIELIKTIGMIILGALSIWFKTSDIAQKKAKDISNCITELVANSVIFISEAEATLDKDANEEKKQWVVDKLMDIIPDKLETYITRDSVETMVQDVFDNVKAYLVAKLDETVEKVDIIKK